MFRASRHTVGILRSVKPLITEEKLSLLWCNRPSIKWLQQSDINSLDSSRKQQSSDNPVSSKSFVSFILDLLKYLHTFSKKLTHMSVPTLLGFLTSHNKYYRRLDLEAWNTDLNGFVTRYFVKPAHSIYLLKTWSKRHTATYTYPSRIFQ